MSCDCCGCENRYKLYGCYCTAVCLLQYIIIKKESNIVPSICLASLHSTDGSTWQGQTVDPLRDWDGKAWSVCLPGVFDMSGVFAMPGVFACAWSVCLPGVFACDDCDKVFKEELKLYAHVKVHM